MEKTLTILGIPVDKRVPFVQIFLQIINTQDGFDASVLTLGTDIKFRVQASTTERNCWGSLARDVTFSACTEANVRGEIVAAWDR